MRTVEEIAEDVLRCALAWEPSSRLVGNVTAEEFGRLAERVLTGKVETPPRSSSDACGDVAPDGAHKCVFGHGHRVEYHSNYPLEWWDGKWIRTKE